MFSRTLRISYPLGVASMLFYQNLMARKRFVDFDAILGLSTDVVAE